ncbi:hypothetical protein RND71_010570 [Anisodus tanguticus]|uniref:FBD domain-containing protein n=1 Tax=Anisodus tanguticus TaxID=243964 RepID=A0AAE1VSS8_9SOLA|nr:hypothetical protein RND71_010570 [Anisodus tanguticus]
MDADSDKDLISDLPQSIIETKVPLLDAVRTSILSRKWRYEWATITQLVFNDTLAHTIRAPNLKYLNLEGEFKDIRLENTPNLVGISVAMCMTDDIAEHFEPSSGCNFDKFLGVPCLERLIGHIYFTKSSSITTTTDIYDLDFWEKDWPSDCIFSKLKIVHMTDFSGLPHEIAFIKFLLGHSPVHEQMIVAPTIYVTDKVVKMLIDLLTFRRASPLATVKIVQESMTFHFVKIISIFLG